MQVIGLAWYNHRYLDVIGLAWYSSRYLEMWSSSRPKETGVKGWITMGYQPEIELWEVTEVRYMKVGIDYQTPDFKAGIGCQKQAPDPDTSPLEVQVELESGVDAFELAS
ncbi:unnamed protein product [Symbiodinium microadriaticum]|nr:unnamed protein product [Symbiodinium microadriaticum]CAE7731010.1 unnamed protein product [Symbiodinium sp. KB8]